LLIPALILLGYSMLFLASLARAQVAGQPDGGRDSGWVLLLALGSLLPLFAVAVDYGRWLHVFVLGLFFALPRRVLLRQEGTPASPHATTLWLLAVLFSLSWSIIHTRAASFQPGALGRLLSTIPVAKLVPAPTPPAPGAAVAPPQSAPTHFAAAGAVFRWKGCELPTVIGKPTGACSVDKRAPALAGHLTYGPYESLPAGDYRLEIRYASAEPKQLAAGAWDVAVPLANGVFVVAQGTLQGSDGAPAAVSLNFSIGAAQALHLVEIRTAANADRALQVDSIELKRLR